MAVEEDNETPILEPLPSPASRFNHLKMGWRKADFQMNLFSTPKIASEQGEQETTMSPGMPSDMYDNTGSDVWGSLVGSPSTQEILCTPEDSEVWASYTDMTASIGVHDTSPLLVTQPVVHAQECFE